MTHTKSHPTLRFQTSLKLSVSALLLAGIGCFFLYDFTVVGGSVPDRWYYALRQLIFAGCGLCSAQLLSHIDYRRLERLWPHAMGWLILLCLGLFLAEKLGYEQLLPSVNIGKLAEVLFLLPMAKAFSTQQTNRRRGLLDDVKDVSRLFLILLLVILALQAGILQTASVILILLVWMGLLFLCRPVWVFGMGSILCGSLLALFIEYSEHFSSIDARILAWMDPFSDPMAAGYPIVQTIYAIADGGLFGTGIGSGTLRYTLDACKSAILPAITQEIGLVGVGLLLLLYLFFLLQAFSVAFHASDRWGFFLAAAIALRFCMVFMLYLSCYANLIPWLDALLFPFLSYGGTNLLTDFCLIGILLSIARLQAESERR